MEIETDMMTVIPAPGGVDVQKPLFKIFVGDGSRDKGPGFTACREYMKKTSTIPVEVIPFRRGISSEFSFTRLWKTNLAGFNGWAVFVGCEILNFGDINQVLNLVDDKYSMMCVNDSASNQKGFVQTASDGDHCVTMVLYNCAHPRNKVLTPEDVDPETSVFLQRFDPSVPLFVWKFLVDDHTNNPATFFKAIHYNLRGPMLDMRNLLSNPRFKMVSLLNPLPAKRRGQINLQAVLLTDGSVHKFSPITLERPKVLLPLVNMPIIDYTLDWLETTGNDQVFLFCGSYWKEIIVYLQRSGWLSKPKFTVTVIDSYNSINTGDALRFLHKRNVIHGDFFLISGDTVSNMSLIGALIKHQDTRRNDSSAVMTMVINQSDPNPFTHQSSLGTDELYIVINPVTKELLYYNESANYPKKAKCLVKELREKYPRVSFHNDKEDCYIDVCSPEVLSFFTNNSHYQHLRSDFVKRLLEDDTMGYKIFTYELESCYTARVDNFRSYDTISKYIMQYWRRPGKPRVGKRACELNRIAINRASGHLTKCPFDLNLSYSVIGKNTSIGKNTVVDSSVIGEGCVIGDDVTIKDCYVWNNVTIEDGCKLKQALICDGVILKSGALLKRGVVLSFNVVVGKDFKVPAYSKVSLEKPIKQDSGEELKYVEQNSACTPADDELSRDFASLLLRSPSRVAPEVGAGGAGYIWPVCDGWHGDWRYSVAPIHSLKLYEFVKHFDVEYLDDQEDGCYESPRELC